MTVIALVSVSASVMVTGLLFTMGLSGGYSPWTYLLFISALSSDVLIDAICISLPLTTYDKQYQCMCKLCDRNCRRCCIRLAKVSRGTAENELVEAVSADQDRGSSGQSGQSGDLTNRDGAAGTQSTRIEPERIVPFKKKTAELVVVSKGNTRNVAIIT